MKKSVYIVATPIGNLQDITLRAIETLQNVDCILAEDTRRTLKLLNHLKIQKPILSFHKFNEHEKAKKLDQIFEQYNNIALVSDAGTPLISDPGQALIDYSVSNQIDITPIPGASAVITQLSVAGLSFNKFTFIGFLPHSTEAKKKLFEQIYSDDNVIVFFESPNKIAKTLNFLSNNYPDADIVIGRELTKLHEEFIRCKCSQVPLQITEKGEFTIALKIPNKNNNYRLDHIKNSDSKDLSDKLANYLKIPKKTAYRLLQDLKQKYSQTEE